MMQTQWLKWAQQIQAIAQTGLHFTNDVYDRERYESLRTLSVEILTTYTDHDMEQVRQLFTNETGYQTPKVDVRAAIFQNEKLLLVREKADDQWALPGGFCDVGLSPKENIIKEVKEEAGFEVLPKRLIAILDQQKHPHPPLAYHYYKIFIHCDISGGSAQTGIETKDVGFFSETQLPTLSTTRNTRSQIDMLFNYLKSDQWETIFD